MFNITDYNFLSPPHYHGDLSSYQLSLSLLPLGMAPMGWDEEETLEQGSSLLPFVLQNRNFR